MPPAFIAIVVPVHPKYFMSAEAAMEQVSKAVVKGNDNCCTQYMIGNKARTVDADTGKTNRGMG